MIQASVSDSENVKQIADKRRIEAIERLNTDLAPESPENNAPLPQEVGSTSKRPRTVWVILVWYLFSAGVSSLSVWAVYSGSIPVTSTKAAYFDNLSAADYVSTVLTLLLNASGAITLFMLKRVSVHLLFAALAISVLTTISQVFTAGLSAALGAGGFIGMLMGYAISMIVCIYALRLKNRGLLA